MSKKIDYCPYCGVRLVADRGTKMKCNTINCEFKDRRHGNSTIDPGLDRRSGNAYPQAPMVNPWENVKMFRY